MVAFATHLLLMLSLRFAGFDSGVDDESQLWVIRVGGAFGAVLRGLTNAR